MLKMRVYASTSPPHDTFGIRVDGILEEEINDVYQWELVEVFLKPGGHIVDYIYVYNPDELDLGDEPMNPLREGMVALL